MEPIKQYIGTIEYNENFYGLVAAIIAVLFTIILFFVLRRKHVARHSVLITGLSESGKTLLFSRRSCAFPKSLVQFRLKKLVSNKKVTTYTSMKENVSHLALPKKKFVNLIDVPGNDRLRSKYIEDYLPSARGFVYVVDSSNIQQCIRDVAGTSGRIDLKKVTGPKDQFMFMLLQIPMIHKSKIPFLVICNKQDHAVSKSSKVIKSLLEKEFNVMRVTQAGRLADTSGSEERVFLGSQNRDFQFSDLKGISVDFLECSALEPGDDNEHIKPIVDWLVKIA